MHTGLHSNWSSFFPWHYKKSCELAFETRLCKFFQNHARIFPMYLNYACMLLRSEIPSGTCAKLRTVAASNNRVHMPWSLYYCLFALHIYVWCCSSRTSRSWWITHLTQHQRRGCNNIPSFLQRTAPIARSLCEGWTRHNLHILVTAPFCCDRKSRVASAQSFAPWQQATIEIMLAISLTIACSRYTYDGVILHAHPIRGESHNQRNTTGVVLTMQWFLDKFSGWLCVQFFTLTIYTNRPVSWTLQSKKIYK